MLKKVKKEKLTLEIIENARSSYGGISLLQMRTLGVVGFEEDWLSHCIDKFYKSTIIKKFLNLKDKHLYENQNGEIVE